MSRSSQPHQNLLKFEDEAALQGYQTIAGVDEVGRGCLAGPVVAAAVVLPWRGEVVSKASVGRGEPFKRVPPSELDGVKDSKQLTVLQREKFFPLIQEKAVAYGFGIVHSEEIDRMNIARASLKAMRLAIESLKIKPDFILVDGRNIIPLLTIHQRPIIKGDALSLSVAAASILAKVKRDELMREWAKTYPHFQFEKHKGYGTKGHWEALKKHGPTPIHRRSFRGVTRK